MANFIKIFSPLLFLFFFYDAYTQKRTISLLKEAKGFVLCYCIQKEYELADSTFKKKLKDYSGAYYVQVSDLSIAAIERLSIYVDSNAHKYRGIPMEKSPANPSANMAAYSCLKMYESKKIEIFIRRLLSNSKYR